MKKTNLVYFLLTGILLCGCGEPIANKSETPVSSVVSSVASSQLKVLANFVNDNALILNEEEREKLTGYLRDIEQKDGLQFYLYTVPELGEQTMQELSLDISTQIQAGQPGLNNGGIIFMSKKDRQLKVEINYGLEWHINNQQASGIIDLIRPELAQGKFYDAFTRGFGQMQKMANTVSWKVAYPDITSLMADKANALGKVVSFQGRGITREYEKVPLHLQFSEELFIQVKVSEKETLRLNFSNYMVEIVNVIVYGNPPPVILGRVAKLDPLEINLLGIED